MTHRQVDVVVALEQAPAPEVVERERLLDRGRRHGEGLQVDDDRVVGSSRTASISARTDSWAARPGAGRSCSSCSGRCRRSSARSRRGTRGPPAPTARARGSSRCRSWRPRADRGAGVALVVQDERRVLPPLVEEERAEAGALDPLQELRRHDLVGVHVGAVERDGRSSMRGPAPSRVSSGVVKWPAIAVAAATAGETRCVRPPLPCRPSKFRFDVDALRSPGCRMSGFIPRHIEQPAPRQSKPASTKTRSRPSRSALQLHGDRAGHDQRAESLGHAATLDDPGGQAQVLDPRVRAGADEDVSGRMSRILVPGSSAM